MRKTAILTMASAFIVMFCLNCLADDYSAQISALEQKAERLQSQINQAKQQNDLVLDQQVKALTGSVESLIKQRVQLDAHIARLENQIEDLKKNSQANLSRQIKSYDEELSAVKQQIASLNAKKAAQSAQAAQPTTPTQNAVEQPQPAAPAQAK